MDKKIQWYFFAGVCFFVAVLSFFVFQPFLSSLALAVFLALLSHPLYVKLLNWRVKRERLAALMTVVLVLFAFITPLFFLTARLVTEARGVYARFQEGQMNIRERLNGSLERVIDGLVPGFSFDIGSYADFLLGWIQDRLGVFVFGTAEGIFLAPLVIFLFYYFLYNGEKVTNELIRLSPLPDTYDTKILEAVRHTVDSVLRGTLFVAFIQGVLVGIGLWVFGIPNPVLLGYLAAFTALLPGIGTGVVLIPSVIFLFLGGEMPMAVGLTIWGVFVVGLVDNFLVPIFYGKNIKVHPVFVLIAVLGGLNFFGFLGFIFGPIVLSLLLVFLDIYRSAVAPHLANQKRR